QRVGESQLHLEQRAGEMGGDRQGRQQGRIRELLLQGGVGFEGELLEVQPHLLLGHVLDAAADRLDEPVALILREHPLQAEGQRGLVTGEPGQPLQARRSPGPARAPELGCHHHLGSFGLHGSCWLQARSSKDTSPSVRPRPVRVVRSCSVLASRSFMTSRSAPWKAALIRPLRALILMLRPPSTLPRRSIWNSEAPALLVPTRTRSTIFWAISLAMARRRSLLAVSRGRATGVGAMRAGLKRKDAAARLPSRCPPP